MAKQKIGTHGTEDERAGKVTKCPMSKAEFIEKAQALTVKLGEHATCVVTPREFSSGSAGWYGQDKVTIVVDGKALKVQVGINLVVVGSKEA